MPHSETALPHRHLFWLGCCVFFIFFSLSLTGLGGGMLADTDPLWHIAAGDLIRAQNAIPQSDPWSYTAGQYAWLNISWGWDALFSALREALGWHGIMAINAMVIAALITVLFAHCLIRSGSYGAAILTAISAVTMLSLFLRPLQVTNLMVALWMLLLGAVLRRERSKYWLALLPASMLLWVNAHGGFITGPLLLGAFMLQAAWERRFALLGQLALTLLATLIAMLCNPYHIGIFEAAWRPLTTVANQFIHEWQPFTASWGNLLSHFYLVAFIALVPMRKLPVLPVERWLAILWFFLALTANRYLSLFAIIAAPVIACGLHPWLARIPVPSATASLREAMISCYNRRAFAIGGSIACACLALWLPSPSAARYFQQEAVAVPDLAPELDYIRLHYPDMRLLIDFNLGAIVAYQTRGEIPVFVDPRTETAFPSQVLQDYLRFYKGLDGWESLFDQYGIGGVMLRNDDEDGLLERFRDKNGWRLAFEGPTATLFVRE
jgi:hypothetical protein